MAVGDAEQCFAPLHPVTDTWMSFARETSQRSDWSVCTIPGYESDRIWVEYQKKYNKA